MGGPTHLGRAPPLSTREPRRLAEGDPPLIHGGDPGVQVGCTPLSAAGGDGTTQASGSHKPIVLGGDPSVWVPRAPLIHRGTPASRRGDPPSSTDERRHPGGVHPIIRRGTQASGQTPSPAPVQLTPGVPPTRPPRPRQRTRTLISATLASSTFSAVVLPCCSLRCRRMAGLWAKRTSQ